jgi:hypothetical protein
MQIEKGIQRACADLLRLIGSDVYELGTRRQRGEYQGTMQTPGIADVEAFLPPRDGRRRLLKMECKAPKGRFSPAQQDYRQHCVDAQVDYVSGGLDDLMAWLSREGYLDARGNPIRPRRATG